MAFRIGQKVVCVDDVPAQMGEVRGGWIVASNDMGGLTKGRVYTIRRCGVDYADGRPVVWLEEIRRKKLRLEPEETGFLSSRFRPATERKTDISAFKEILDRENHGLPSRVDYPADCEPK